MKQHICDPTLKRFLCFIHLSRQNQPWNNSKAFLFIFSFLVPIAQFKVYRTSDGKNSKHKVNNLPSALFGSNNVETIFENPSHEFTFCLY